MSALTSLQDSSGGDAAASTSGSTSGLDDAATDLANDLISQFGTDGSLSLSDIETALGSSNTSPSGASTSDASTTDASATSALSAAFSSLDTNGDGALSSSELANGLEQAMAGAGPPPGGPPPGGPPPGGPAGASSFDASSTSAATTSDSSTSATAPSDSGSASGTSSTAGGGIDAQTLANALQAMLMQFAQSAYSSVSDLTNSTTPAAVTTA